MKIVKTLAVTIITALITTVAVCGASAPIGVTIDGMPVTFADAKPYIDSSSRTMIPVRAVSESMGGKVTWDDKTRTVTIVRQDKTVELEIGKKGILVNKVGALMDTAAQITDSRTYVPLRFVGEAFGMKVTWDGSSRTVCIATTGGAATNTASSFDKLPTRPATATESSKINSEYFVAKTVAEVEKSMFPVQLEYSAIQGVYKSTKDNMFIIKISCEGYPDGRRYSQLEHFVQVDLKNGQSFITGPMHFDQGALKYYPALSKFSNVATEQKQSAVGASEWTAAYFTKDITNDFKISDVKKISIWDENTGHFDSKGYVLLVPMTEIPEI